MNHKLMSLLQASNEATVPKMEDIPEGLPDWAMSAIAIILSIGGLAIVAYGMYLNVKKEK